MTQLQHCQMLDGPGGSLSPWTGPNLGFGGCCKSQMWARCHELLSWIQQRKVRSDRWLTDHYRLMNRKPDPGVSGVSVLTGHIKLAEGVSADDVQNVEHSEVDRQQDERQQRHGQHLKHAWHLKTHKHTRLFHSSFQTPAYTWNDWSHMSWNQDKGTL